MPVDDRPNPGSDEAVEAGCICARMDNGYGRGVMGGARGPGGGIVFVTRGDCPLHGQEEETNAE